MQSEHLGMTNKVLFDVVSTTGVAPTATVAGDLGELMVNISDRKLYARDAAGAAVPVTKYIADHDPALAYKAGDLVINGTQFLRCNADIAAKAFDAGDWTVISPAGGTGSSALLKAPTAVDHNTVDLTGLPTTFGLVVTPDTNQSVDLLRVGGAGPSGARSRIDRFGVPAPGLSGNVRVVSQVGHPFSSRGQPVAYDGTYKLAVSTDPALYPVAIVEEVIDVNSLIIRYSGWTEQLQAASFPGASITDGAIYYLSNTPGGLSLTPPATGDTIPVLFTSGTNSARVLIAPVTSLALSGGELSGGLSFGSSLVGTPTDLSRHISLYGTTSGISVSTDQQVNIVSNAGAGRVKIFGGLEVEEAEYASIDFNTTSHAAGKKRWAISTYENATLAIRAKEDDNLSNQGGYFDVTRDEGGLTDVKFNPHTPLATLTPQSVMTLERILDIVYPVGTIIYMGIAGNPGTWIPGTTWVAEAPGRTIVGVGTADGYNWTLGQLRGNATRTLSWSNMPAHTHTIDPPSTPTTSDSHTHNYTRESFSTDGGAGSIGSSNFAKSTYTTSTTSDTHSHTVNISPFASSSAGSGTAFEIFQPSIAAYIWRRTA